MSWMLLRGPTPFRADEDDADTEDQAVITRRVDRDRAYARFMRLVFAGGWLALLAFVILALRGLPGTGVLLVPLGLGMLIGSAIELFIGRI